MNLEKNHPARLVVVDDHALFRSGLVNIIAQMEGYQVVGEAGHGREALDVIREADPDLVLIDVNMPVMDGIETVQAIREQDEEVRLVMLTISRESADLTRAIRAGANGYILKNAEPEELEGMLGAVLDSHAVISPEMTGEVFDLVRRGPGQGEQDLLTDRERDVLECLAEGMTTAEAAEALVVSQNTIKTHVRHILKKLKVSNRAEAVKVGVKKGLL